MSIVADHYQKDGITNLRDVMQDTLDLLSLGMRDSGVWLLESYLYDLDYETYMEQQDHPASDWDTNGVGPLGT